MDFMEYVRLCKGDLREYAALRGKVMMGFEGGKMTLHVDPSVEGRLQNVGGFFEMLEFYLTCEVFGGGPKVFRPTAEQLRLLEQMTLNVPFQDYAQPFETVVVEFPPDFRDMHLFDSVETNDLVKPLFSVVHHRGGQLLHSVYTSELTTLKAWWKPHPEHELEVWLDSQYTNGQASDQELDMETRVRRCVLAYCLLLDEVGVRKLGPAKPGQYGAFRKTAEKCNEHSVSARVSMKVHPFVYELDQHVVLHRTVESAAELGEPTGRVLTPHHRRGYYRMQPCGPKNSLRRRVRVPPVFVNKHLFLGSMADARALYTGAAVPAT
jgi:hypothetical protein